VEGGVADGENHFNINICFPHFVSGEQRMILPHKKGSAQTLPFSLLMDSS